MKSGIPGGIQAIRDDRVLFEAHASGGGIRRICDVLGLSVTAAGRYTATTGHPGLAGMAGQPCPCRKCHPTW